MSFRRIRFSDCSDSQKLRRPSSWIMPNDRHRTSQQNFRQPSSQSSTRSVSLYGLSGVIRWLT